MTRKPTGKPNGRPAIKVVPPTQEKWSGKIPEREINLDQVLYWIELQATQEEIAGAFRVDVSTLDNKLKEAFGMGFSELKNRCSGACKIGLRRYQYQQSEKNATMAIWLGKVWLGQREPESIQYNAPYQQEIDKDQIIMFLQNEIEKLKNSGTNETTQQPKTE